MRILILAVATMALAWPQQPAAPAFEAATVKPHPDTGKRDRARTIEPGRLTFRDITLGELIAVAYDLKPYQLSGPEWIVGRSSAVSFDVVATAGQPVPPAEIHRMLQPLLAERFHLTFHRETRELPVFALLAAKGGPKAFEPGDDGPHVVSPTPDGGISFRNWTLDEFADWLSVLPGVGRPVLDRTGVPGTFSFHGNLFAMEKGAEPAAMKRAFADGDAAGTLRATLPDQLGLRLDPQKASIEILVIDRADRTPAEN